MYEKLKELRKQKNVKIKELSEALGLKTEGAYWKKENRKVPITIEEAIIISKKLNVKLEKIFL